MVSVVWMNLELGVGCLDELGGVGCLDEPGAGCRLSG